MAFIIQFIQHVSVVNVVVISSLLVDKYCIAFIYTIDLHTRYWPTKLGAYLVQNVRRKYGLYDVCGVMGICYLYWLLACLVCNSLRVLASHRTSHAFIIRVMNCCVNCYCRNYTCWVIGKCGVKTCKYFLFLHYNSFNSYKKYYFENVINREVRSIQWCSKKYFP